MTDDSLVGEPVRILLVEDNKAHAELVRRCLEEQGTANKVYHVSSGELALDYLFGQGEFADAQERARPHVILLDLRLPGMDGIEVIRQCKHSEELKKIPIVVLTTSDAKPDILGAYESDVSSYLVKPLEHKTFQRVMRDLGFFWLVWNCYPW